MEGFLNLAWLVPIPPFLAFVAIILFLNRNKTVSAITAIAARGQLADRLADRLHGLHDGALWRASGVG